MTLAAACLIAAFVVGHPVVSQADRERWINRSKPRALLRGRPRKYRFAAVLFIGAAALGALAAVINILSDSTWWLFALGVIIPVESLVMVDMLQHRQVEPVA